MYHSVIGKPSLRVRLLMGLLGLSLLLLSACGGQVSAKGGGDDDEENESASGAPTRNGQIAFRRFFDPDQSEGAIFTVNPDGSHESQITHPPKNGWIDESSDWSPDGQRLAFDRHTPKDMSRIMVLNTKTGDTREVTHCGSGNPWAMVDPTPAHPHPCDGDYFPAFSPDGRSIAFQRYSGGTKACCWLQCIWIVGADGSNPHQVTNIDETPSWSFTDWASEFSPDGKKLVFDRSTNRKHEEDEHHAVFVQPIDSSGSPEDARQLTPWKMECQDAPEYSPDGKLVLFRYLPKGEEGPSNLYWVHPDGTGLHQLTHSSPDDEPYYFSQTFSPSFSDGEGWITAGRQPGYGKEGNADVFRLLIKDGEVTRSVNLTKSGKWESAAHWGPHPPVD
jgi:Tol biopolymer transport system component